MASLAHLYIAVEALTKASIRHECERKGLSEEDLARANNINPGPQNGPPWHKALESWARSTLIFDGDTATYSAARRASDGIEHGFLPHSEINAHARTATLTTFKYVRRVVLRLLGLAEESALVARPPLDVNSWRKMVRGYLVGDVQIQRRPDKSTHCWNGIPYQVATPCR